MELKNCKRCGKLFAYSRNDVCPDCVRREEETFQLVRDFLKEFPGSKITEVNQNTGVSIKKLMQYLREGRIEILDDGQNYLKCLKCGEPIKVGKYCEKCFRNYRETINNLYTVNEDSDNKIPPKMRFINRIK